MHDRTRRRRHLFPLAVVAAATMGVARGTPGAWRFMRTNGGQSLPAQGTDGHGNSWNVYQPTYIQSQSNMPVYGQTANLQVNGQQPSSNGNAAHIDPKTGELVIDQLTAGTITVTRRILIDADAGGVRVTDVFHNTTAAEQPLAVTLSSSVNYGVQQSLTVADPKRPDKQMAWVAQVPAGPGRAVADVYAGPNAKVSPTIESQPGNNVATATIQTVLPANADVALVHYHIVTQTTEQAQAWITAMRPSKLLADLPKDVRRAVVNFRVSTGLLGDQEVLRGDLLDTVELRNGDRLNGNLGTDPYQLEAFYGTVELPVDRVVGLVTTGGAYNPRQLLVTTDGQIYGGHLHRPTIDLQLTSGQRVSIPLAQVARVGYRRRPGEPADGADANADGTTTLKPPYVLLATGDRIGVARPDQPITVVTRYGPLSIPAGVLAGINFGTGAAAADPDAAPGLHTVSLTDGTHFGGLVTVPDFTATLNTAGPTTQPSTTRPPATTLPTTVHFPIASLSRIVFAGDDPDKPADAAAEDAPQLRVGKDDLLVGTLTGTLKIDTAFDTITLDAAEVRGLTRGTDGGAGGSADLTVTTWDGTEFRGQVQDPTVACHLACGIDVRVPLDLIVSYTNPTPAVPELMRAKIKILVVALDAEDWQARDAAEQQLAKLGPSVAGALRQARGNQSPEAQQRIDAILRQLATQKK